MDEKLLDILSEKVARRLRQQSPPGGQENGFDYGVLFFMKNGKKLPTILSSLGLLEV